MNTIRNFFKDETGSSLSEYAVAAGLIAVAVATAFTSLGTQLNTTIKSMTNAIRTSMSSIAE